MELKDVKLDWLRVVRFCLRKWYNISLVILEICIIDWGSKIRLWGLGLGEWYSNLRDEDLSMIFMEC